MADSPLVALVKLTPKEAVAYLEKRNKLTKSFNWQDVWQEEHAHQFTVSRLANLDILESMRDGILSSVKGDSSRQDWTKNAKELLIQAGWWGKKSISDPATGDIVTTTFDPPRVKLIFDTNTRMAYATGQWQRIERNKVTHPYIRYITRRDERVRELHRSWDNRTLPIDDPFWRTHFPPNGWRCRCRVVSISQADYDTGLSPNGETLNKTEPTIEYRNWVNKRTGAVERVPVGIDPGFAYNPGMSEARAENLAKVSLGKLNAFPAVMRRAAISPTVIGEVSSNFQKAVNSALDVIPEEFRSDVFSRGYQVVLGKRVVDIEPSLAGVTPRGYEGTDITWENLDGGYLGGFRIAIAEYSLSRTGAVIITDDLRAGQLLRHEFGHALDSARSISSSGDFVNAYSDDISALLPFIELLGGDALDQLKYFMQIGQAGREEIFSELFAEAYGGGTADAINVAVAFPKAYAIVKTVLNSLPKVE